MAAAGSVRRPPAVGRRRENRRQSRTWAKLRGERQAHPELAARGGGVTRLSTLSTLTQHCC